jgi:LysM repeat protein
VDTRTYTVQPGDTLYKLSLRFGTTVDDLVALNDIRNPDLIYVGQVLLVPAAGAPAAPPTGGPLSLSWERIGVRYEGQDYISKLHITAQGGQPPYTYYHDGIVQAGNTFEVAWRRGRAKPGSVGVADATGTYVKEDYWLQDPCDYPAGVEIIQPSEGDELKTYPRNFNITWRNTIDPPPDAYWIEIQVWQDGGYQPWQLYYHKRGDSELFFVPDVFPGDLGGRLRMWGVYGSCEAREKTPWRYFEFRVTY